MAPDPRPTPRILDQLAKRRAVLTEPVCVVCEDERSTDPHHVLPRGQRGDDIAANLVGVCRQCHDRVTVREPVAVRMLGEYLELHRPDTLQYLTIKLGSVNAAYLWALRNLGISD